MKIFKDKKIDKLRFEFLPSALEISETPANPIGSKIIYFVFLILIFFIVFSSVAKVDIVAVARGTIVPNGRIKVVQTLEEGVVTGIYVEEGDLVKKGDLLIELDKTMKSVDEESITKNIKIATLEKEILNKYLDGEGIESIKAFVNDYEASEDVKKIIVDFVISIDESYKTRRNVYLNNINQSAESVNLEKVKLNNIESQIATDANDEILLKNENTDLLAKKEEFKLKLSELRVLENEERESRFLLEKEEITADEYKEKIDSLEAKKNEVSDLERIINDKERENLNQQVKNTKNSLEHSKRNIELQKVKIREMQTRLYESNNNLASFDKKHRLDILNDILQKQKEIENLKSSLKKVENSFTYTSIKSPVDGVVQGILPNTVGGVIKPAEIIMTIVPADTPLVVEAFVQNKDIAYVSKGQEVSIKVDAYSFQKYGVIKGVVSKISPDAVEDKKYGLVYKVKVTLKDKNLDINGREMKLSSGMTVVAEVKTGKRRVIEFLLEPLVKYIEEAFKVR